MATSLEIAALGAANMPDNNSGDITPAKMRETFTSMLDHLGGNIYYTNSSTTKQTATAATPLTLTNDGIGSLSVSTKRPYYLTAGTFFANNKLQMADIKDGTVINVRLEFEFVTPANTEVEITAIFRDSEGTEAFRLQFEDVFYKASGTHKKVSNFLFFMDDNITDGTMELSYNSDTNTSVIWKSLMADIR